MPSRRKNRILGRLALMTVPLILSFCIIEFVLYRVEKNTPTNQQSILTEPSWLTAVPNSELGWIFPPSTTGIFKSSGSRTHVVTNSWGLRSPEVSADSTARRLLVLGDSYAFGWGVNDHEGFVRLLETELRRNEVDVPVEVINGGLPGYSIYQQIRMLEYVSQKTKIHTVVATISLANDLVDEKRIRRFAPNHLADFNYELHDPNSSLAKFISSSRLITLMDQRTTHLQFSMVNTSRECRDLADESLRDLAFSCQQAGLPLIWVLVPRAKEIQSGSFWENTLNDSTNRLRQHYLEFAASLDIPIVDLKPALSLAQAQQDVFLPADAHWNQAGHQAVVTAILPVVGKAWTVSK